MRTFPYITYVQPQSWRHTYSTLNSKVPTSPHIIKYLKRKRTSIHGGFNVFCIKTSFLSSAFFSRMASLSLFKSFLSDFCHERMMSSLVMEYKTRSSTSSTIFLAIFGSEVVGSRLGGPSCTSLSCPGGLFFLQKTSSRDLCLLNDLNSPVLLSTNLRSSTLMLRTVVSKMAACWWTSPEPKSSSRESFLTRWRDRMAMSLLLLLLVAGGSSYCCWRWLYLVEPKIAGPLRYSSVQEVRVLGELWGTKMSCWVSAGDRIISGDPMSWDRGWGSMDVIASGLRGSSF